MGRHLIGAVSDVWQIADIVVIVAVVTCGGFAAWHSFPVWDDGVLALNLLENGTGALAKGELDRPVMGAIWTALARRGWLWWGSAIVYAATWIASGWVTARIWRWFFPELESLSVVAALVAVSPILLETQAIAINPVFSGHAGAMLVFGGQLMLWSQARPRTTVRTTVAGLLVVAGCLVSEYAALAAVTSGLAFYMRLGYPQRTPEERRSDRLLLVSMIGCAVLGYALYWMLGDADARPNVRPERGLFAFGLRNLVQLPVRLLNVLWGALIAEPLRDLGDVTFSSATVWGLPFGLLLGAFVLCRTRAGELGVARRSSGDRQRIRKDRPDCSPSLGLWASLVVGIAATLILRPWGRGHAHETRFWQPLLPIAACLSLCVLLSVVRAKFRAVLAALIAVTSGYLQVNLAVASVATNKRMHLVAEQLHQALAPTGLTVAMFTNFPPTHIVLSAIPQSYELIGKLTKGWPAADRARFWAGAYGPKSTRESVHGLGGACGPAREVDEDSQRVWSRRGEVAKVLWVSFDDTGVHHIETVNGTPLGVMPSTESVDGQPLVRKSQ